jgi:Na+-driven multidrug efflux pump
MFFLPGIYYDGFLSLVIMAPGYLIFTTTTLLAAYFSANRLLKINLIGSVLCCVLMILLDLILIPTLSYKGAAIANVIAYSVTTIYFLYRSIAVIKISPHEFFTIKRSDFDIFSGKVIITTNQDS